jgi:hypothetical protein
MITQTELVHNFIAQKENIYDVQNIIFTKVLARNILKLFFVTGLTHSAM